MTEKLRKRVGTGLLAGLAGGTLYFFQTNENGSVHPRSISTAETTTLSTYLESDVLKQCRIEKDQLIIDQVCAFEQAREEITADDIVMAGIWAYHVQEKPLRIELDHLELGEAHDAAQTKRMSDCATWASRVIEPVLRDQLPSCE